MVTTRLEPGPTTRIMAKKRAGDAIAQGSVIAVIVENIRIKASNAVITIDIKGKLVGITGITLIAITGITLIVITAIRLRKSSKRPWKSSRKLIAKN